MLRRSNDDAIPLLSQQELELQQGEVSGTNFNSLSADALEHITQYLGFNDVIPWMLSCKKVFRLFDHPEKLNRYAMQVPVNGQAELHHVYYKQVNYMLLRAYFYGQQVDALNINRQYMRDDAESSIRPRVIGMGVGVGCVVTGLVSLPLPIIACVSGMGGCVTVKTIVGTSLVGPLLGLGIGARSASHLQETRLSEEAELYQRNVRNMTASYRVLTLRNKSLLQLQSLFAANQIVREKKLKKASKEQSELPRRVKMT